MAMAEKKPAHEVLVENIAEYLAKIANCINKGWGHEMSTVSLSCNLGILQQIKIPEDKLPWVTKRLDELAEEFKGRVDNMEYVVQTTISELVRDNQKPITDYFAQDGLAPGETPLD